MYKLFLKTHRVVHTENVFIGIVWAVPNYSVPGLDKQSSMVAKQEKLAFYWGCWAMILTWHRYIYKNARSGPLKLEEAGLQGTKPI